MVGAVCRQQARVDEDGVDGVLGEYSIFVMTIKAFLTLAVVFMAEARLRQAMLTLVINLTWLCVLSFATPYLRYLCSCWRLCALVAAQLC